MCTAWYKVSQQCSLWRTVDLGTWGRDRFKTEPRLKWLIENRLQHATEVGLGKLCWLRPRRVMLAIILLALLHSCFFFTANWKVTNVQCVLDKLLEAAPGLTTISLAGWKALSTDHLMFLVQNFKSLRNLDLSSVNVSHAGVGVVAATVFLNQFIFIFLYRLK